MGAVEAATGDRARLIGVDPNYDFPSRDVNSLAAGPRQTLPPAVFEPGRWLHLKEIGELQEEPVFRSAEAGPSELAGISQGTAIPGEEYGAGIGLLTTALLNPLPLVDPVSTSAPSDCTPNGFTAKTVAWRPSLKVLTRIWMLSSASIRSQR